MTRNSVLGGAAVMKIRSPQTIGEDQPSREMAVFHLMFSVSAPFEREDWFRKIRPDRRNRGIGASYQRRANEAMQTRVPSNTATLLNMIFSTDYRHHGALLVPSSGIHTLLRRFTLNPNLRFSDDNLYRLFRYRSKGQPGQHLPPRAPQLGTHNCCAIDTCFFQIVPVYLELNPGRILDEIHAVTATPSKVTSGNPRASRHASCASTLLSPENDRSRA